MTVALESETESASNRKWIVRLDDGAEVEAVLYRGDTLCVSSQVGCAVRCPFCASGANGLGRSLAFEEIVAQVLAVEAKGHALARTTVSGVGEPMHNPDAVLRFVEFAHARGTLASVTTTGGRLARLPELLAAPHNGVTLSIHAGTDETRAAMVPHGPSLAEVRHALEALVPALGRNKRKKLALAYLLVEGRNDTTADLEAFADRFGDLGLAVHLYALNPVPTSSVRAVSREDYERAYARLRERGLVVRMSSKARIEANGGCGTLVATRRTAGANRVVDGPSAEESR